MLSSKVPDVSISPVSAFAATNSLTAFPSRHLVYGMHSQAKCHTNSLNLFSHLSISSPLHRHPQFLSLYAKQKDERPLENNISDPKGNATAPESSRTTSANPILQKPLRPVQQSSPPISKKPRPTAPTTRYASDISLAKKRRRSKRTVEDVEASLSATNNSKSKQKDTDSGRTQDTGLLSLDEKLRMEAHDVERQGDVELACKLYWRAVEVDSRNGKAWQDLAKAEGRRKRSMGASVGVLMKALAENPRNPYLWQSLGFLKFRMQRHEEARAHFSTGISRDPSHAPLYGTYALMEASIGNYARARELYEKGVSMLSGGARVYHSWGAMELKLGNLDRAEELFEKGLKLEPFNAYIWQSKGSIAREANEIDRARTCYENALKSEANNVVVLDEWAKLEVATGNDEMARRLFARGVSANESDRRIVLSWSIFEYQVCCLSVPVFLKK